jgi:hypothetical protein
VDKVEERNGRAAIRRTGKEKESKRIEGRRTGIYNTNVDKE